MAEKNIEHDNRAPPRVENVPGAPGQTRVVETDDSARQGPKGSQCSGFSWPASFWRWRSARFSCCGAEGWSSAPVTCLSNKLLSQAFAWIGINARRIR